MALDENGAGPQDILLEIRDLKTHFALDEGTVRAVDGVDLDVRRRQVVGVVGESGCGKSMTAMSIMRLIPPPGQIVEGEIRFHRQFDDRTDAKDIVDLAQFESNDRQLRDIRGNQISMVFQEPMTALSPVRTVGKQITEAILLHQDVNKAEARDIAIETLARVKMPNPEQRFDDYPFQLSGGMRQRAVIAMALACRPQLLIADEPTTALDVTTEAQILDLMRELQAEYDMSILYITHNLGVVAEMAEDVVVMYMGKVVERTDVDSIFYNPKHPYTKGLLNSIPRLEDVLQDKREKLNAIEGMVPSPYQRLQGCSFHPRCPDFMPGVCDEAEPQLIQLDEGHAVRCHLYT
ncbi:MAG: ABC transporter ATP-binding protein [Caldilineaceae bacterium]|nr:ABC transporter ATP-binding protein [Caldilineaceae bacterium]MDE0462591.1 ABC transporter ATP-binding protein [Caldilineaceae bacterium]MDE0464273.1 ABC transporter ATP-binding protein [Caldilineaceae bacterium]MXX24704.1 ABC transporter ATP-binding protein [Caldilineaceae bacterium SB0668_bin_21]MYC23014.1 ABC transporter ATP-binding protein [Caldilineaceae bacterium SB0662_bin_25]